MIRPATPQDAAAEAVGEALAGTATFHREAPDTLMLEAISNILDSLPRNFPSKRFTSPDELRKLIYK